jgi:hypothetical protein
MPTDAAARSEANAILAELSVAERSGCASGTGLRIEKPDELTWWDWTVFLLHTAAEIEHALMVQYLYAAYSLADAGHTGTDVPPNAVSRMYLTSSKLSIVPAWSVRTVCTHSVTHIRRSRAFPASSTATGGAPSGCPWTSPKTDTRRKPV